MTGTGRDPTTCRNTAEQRQYQLIYQRARGRAVTALIAAHKAEYDHLFALHRAEVDAEAQQVEQTARQGDHDHGDEPARLKTGRRGRGQTVVDRIDVARCPHCIKHHDRGHVCAVCGAAPSEPLSDSRNANRVTHNTTRRATNQNLDSRSQSDDGHLNEQASKVGNLPTSADAAQMRRPAAGEQANEQAACSSDDRLSDKPRRTRSRPRVYDGLGLPRKPPPNLDLDAIAEFNAGVERARKAARR